MESGTTTGAQRPSPDVYEPRKLPPVAQLIVVSVTLMISSGVYLASHLPKAPPLGPALGLVAAGGLFTVVAMVTPRLDVRLIVLISGHGKGNYCGYV